MIKALRKIPEWRGAFAMQKYESDQQKGNEVSNQPIFHHALEPHWDEAEFFEMAGAYTGVIIDNGGSEVTALNDW